ncbi:MAG: hypothetical protein ACREAC_19355, partial [Blastocatellia bacterium]
QLEMRAGSTLEKARFFLEEAERRSRRKRPDLYEISFYLEAAMIFAGSALDQLDREYGDYKRYSGGRNAQDARVQVFRVWHADLMSSSSCQFMKRNRDRILHDMPEPRLTELVVTYGESAASLVPNPDEVRKRFDQFEALLGQPPHGFEDVWREE